VLKVLSVVGVVYDLHAPPAQVMAQSRIDQSLVRR
jgi:hypothetical protein